MQVGGPTIKHALAIKRQSKPMKQKYRFIIGINKNGYVDGVNVTISFFKLLEIYPNI